MSTNKDCTTYSEDYFIKTCAMNMPGHTSPSSWDDTDEDELFNINSYDFIGENYDDETSESEATAEDRRQSLPRVRRRSTRLDGSREPLDHNIADQSNTLDNDWDREDNVGRYREIENFLKTKTKIQLRPTNNSDTMTNPHPRLPKILESEELNLNCSLERGETSSVPYQKENLWHSDGCLNDRIVDTLEGDSPNTNHDIKIYSSEDSSDEKTNTISERDSDNSEEMWNRIRSRIRKNAEFSMSCEDSNYVNNSLKYIFDTEPSTVRVSKERNNDIEDDSGKQSIGESSAETKEQLFQSLLERENVGDKISIDGVEDAGNKKGTPKRDGNLSGRRMDHALSNESVEFELENPFRVMKFPLSSAAANNLEGMSNAVTQTEESPFDGVPTPRSGREIFLRDLSNGKSKIFSKDFDYAKTPSLTIENREESTQTPTPGSRKFLLSSDGRLDMENNEIEEWTNRECKKSTESFRSKITLDLDLSEDEEISSTVERRIFGGTPCRTGTVLTGNTCRTGSTDDHSNRKLISFDIPPKKTDISAGEELNKSEINFFHGRNELSLTKSDRFGFGDICDTRRNTNKINESSSKIDHPKDRGDMKFDNYNVKSEWKKLIVQLDERNIGERRESVHNIFWIDLERRERVPVTSWESKQSERIKYNNLWTSSIKNELYVPDNYIFKKFPYSNSPIAKRIKAKKRKRESRWYENTPEKNPNEAYFLINSRTNQKGTPYFSYLNTSSRQKVFNRPKNWFINSFARRKDFLVQKSRPVEEFLLKKLDRTPCVHTTQNMKPHSVEVLTSQSSASDCFCNLFKQFINLLQKIKK